MNEEIDRTMPMLSTQTCCPQCNSNEVYLSQCRNAIWKVCDNCRTVYFCEDAGGGIFTDWDMKRYCEENETKSIKDYEEYKLALLKKRFKGYTKKTHPIVTQRQNIYSDEYIKNGYKMDEETMKELEKMRLPEKSGDEEEPSLF